MIKLTLNELYDKFREFNKINCVSCKGVGDEIFGVIVFTEASFSKPYSLESRSYRVSSSNNAFIAGKVSNSVFGSSLAGDDPHVKLSSYMALDEGSWEVDYCYLEDEDE